MQQTPSRPTGCRQLTKDRTITQKLPSAIIIRIETAFAVDDLVEFLENHDSEITLPNLVALAKQMLETDRDDYYDSNAIEQAPAYDEQGKLIYA